MLYIHEGKRNKKPSEPTELIILTVTLHVTGVDGTFDDRCIIERNISRITTIQLWLRKSVREEIEAVISHSTFPFYEDMNDSFFLGTYRILGSSVDFIH